jgi:hypothetical protein
MLLTQRNAKVDAYNSVSSIAVKCHPWLITG